MKNKTVQDFSFIPNIPKLGAAEDMACVSFMFYDSEKKLNQDWLEWLELIFSSFDTEPDRILFHFEGKTRRGKYSRLKKTFFSALEKGDVDFQLRSRAIEGHPDFFPSEISISINTSGPGNAQGVISIVENKVPNIFDFSNNIASELVSLAGNFYAHSSKFPMILGPDSYAAAVGTIPKGWSFNSTKAYTERLTAWRNNTRDLTHIETSFREIFPINFLKDSHIKSTIGGTPAKSLYEMYGLIIEVSPNSNQYLWKVESNKLQLLRKIMEKEGLILSRP